MSTILVTNAQQRKALSFARSLGEKGETVLCCDTTDCNPVRFSKYCNGFCKQSGNESLAEFLLSSIQKKSVDVLVPMDEDSMEAVLYNKEIFEKACRFALPSVLSYETAVFKDKAVRLAENAGVSCPDTLFTLELWYESGNKKEFLWLLYKKAGEIGYPLVIKPVKSSGSRGIAVVKDPKLFMETFLSIHEKYPFPLVQSYVKAKDKYDVCLLYNKKGELRACFVQKEIRHYPERTGPSTVQQSVDRPDILQEALKVMNKLPWEGVVELEFLVDDEEQSIVFMEINPRFWASLEAAVLSGVDFPWLYTEIARTGDCPFIGEYTVGKTVRWFWPGDLLFYMTAKNRDNLWPGFFDGARKGIADDIYRRSDPFPVLGVWLQSFYYMLRKERRDFVLRRTP